MERLLVTIGFIVGTMFLLCLIAILMGFPVMWLWNYTIPSLSNGAINVIDFWQAICLNALCSILFKSSNITSGKK